jgi:hypothetical protein
MRKIFVLFCVLVLSLALLQTPARAQSKFGFKVSGGLIYAGGGDINAGVQGWYDFYHDYLQLLGYSATGTYSPFHLGMDFQGEFLFNLSPEMALGLGAGYLSVSKDSALTGTSGSKTITLTFQPKVHAIPITFNFHYYLPAGNTLKFVLTAGVGYYLTKIDHTLGATGSGSVEKYDFSAGGFGFHGGVGLDLALSPAVSLVLDLLGRYATASGYTGSYTSGSTTHTNVNLYYYEGSFPGFGTYPQLTYDTTLPSGSGVNNAREAKLDLSGFSALIGFVFHF